MNQEQIKWFAAFVAALLFWVISNPVTYIMVSKGVYNLLGGKITIASQDGRPTGLGLIVHSIVFLLLVRSVMEFNFQKEEKPASS